MSPNSSNFRIGLMRPDPLTTTVGESRKTRTANLTSRDIASLDPIGNKNIRLTLLRAMAIRSEDQFLSVRRKHRKAVKRVVVGNPLHPCAVNVNHIKIKITPLRISDVRRKDHPPAVGKEIGCEAGFVQMRHLSLV